VLCHVIYATNIEVALWLSDLQLYNAFFAGIALLPLALFYLQQIQPTPPPLARSIPALEPLNEINDKDEKGRKAAMIIQQHYRNRKREDGCADSVDADDDRGGYLLASVVSSFAAFAHFCRQIWELHGLQVVEFAQMGVPPRDVVMHYYVLLSRVCLVLSFAVCVASTVLIYFVVWTASKKRIDVVFKRSFVTGIADEGFAQQQARAKGEVEIQFQVHAELVSDEEKKEPPPSQPDDAPIPEQMAPLARPQKAVVKRTASFIGAQAKAVFDEAYGDYGQVVHEGYLFKMTMPLNADGSTKRKVLPRYQRRFFVATSKGFLLYYLSKARTKPEDIRAIINLDMCRLSLSFSIIDLAVEGSVIWLKCGSEIEAKGWFDRLQQLKNSLNRRDARTAIDAAERTPFVSS